MDDETTPPVEAVAEQEKVEEGVPPPGIPDFEFRDGMEGCEIQEVRMRFLKGPATRIGGVRFNPQQGVTGLQLQSDMRSGRIDTIVLTFGKEGDGPTGFPGLTFEADVDMLLMLRDDDWRAKVLAGHREAWEAKRREDEAAKLLEVAPPDTDVTPGLLQ
jgi:hypothetical protein